MQSSLEMSQQWPYPHSLIKDNNIHFFLSFNANNIIFSYFNSIFQYLVILYVVSNQFLHPLSGIHFFIWANDTNN